MFVVIAGLLVLVYWVCLMALFSASVQQPHPANAEDGVSRRVSDELPCALAVRHELNPGENVPIPQELLYHLYGALVLSKGVQCTSSDVHDAWSIWATYNRPADPFLIPFAELPEEVQRLDDKYAAAIRAVARRLSPSSAC